MSTTQQTGDHSLEIQDNTPPHLGRTYSEKLRYPAPPSEAVRIMQAGIMHMDDRAATYDKPQGERSIPAVVKAFAAITGVELTEEQGWLFMEVLKLVRSQQGGYRVDNYEDAAAYAGLRGEAAKRERHQEEAYT
ncbi:MAG: DUF6378 domain-containing protein [Xanthomonadales bacterium]|nr:DUF6378 domain-containing protein [Xanthomonadales bacterium]